MKYTEFTTGGRVEWGDLARELGYDIIYNPMGKAGACLFSIYKKGDFEWGIRYDYFIKLIMFRAYYKDIQMEMDIDVREGGIKERLMDIEFLIRCMANGKEDLVLCVSLWGMGGFVGRVLALS